MTYLPKVHGHSLQAGFSRRRFVTGLLGGGAALGMVPVFGSVPASAGPRLQRAEFNSPDVLSGRDFQLDIDYLPVNFTGRDRVATAVNGSVPAPVLRWREGDRVTLTVTNHLTHDSSIHWHGMILPTSMDGVPGLSFDGIKPGHSYEYQFEVQQNGTYWYHSHSGFQEQTGLYGAIVIDPHEPDPVAYDREHVILLSDWSDTAPEDIYANLKKQSDYYNYQERTAGDLWQDLQRKGVAQTWRERAMWNQMRMSQADISDVTGSTYTYLINGVTPAQGWRGLFQRGEKVRLRFINGSAMTIFDVRIPGLTMTVVAADGQNVQPVTVDEFRIGTAETYDVIVEPSADRAYTIFAQNMDRSGYTRGTLTPDPAWQAEIPAMEASPRLSHRDMGMGHMGMAHAGTEQAAMEHAGMEPMSKAHTVADMRDQAAMDGQSGMSDQADTAGMHDMGDMHGTHDPDDALPMDGMDHTQHSMGSMSGMQTMGETHQHHAPGQMMTTPGLGKAGFGSTATIQHDRSEFGPQVDMRTADPMDGLSDPGVGLRDHQQRFGRRVLTYADLRNLTPTRDRREPSREIEIHLTGNMHRYMWSMNGVKFADAEPLQLTHGERVRILLVNDTMMTHPIHLHGLWSELETGDPERIPRKHTILVQPGAKISYLVTADALGRWAYHCHLMFHMPGMFREVRVSHGGVS